MSLLRPAFLTVMLLTICTVMILPLQVRGDTSGPAQVIERFNATLIGAMKGGKELGYNGRYRLIDPVVRESFSMPYMAGVSVGRYWKTLTKTQQQQLVNIYTEWSIASYAKNFDEYTGESFEIVGQPQTAGDNAKVLSKLVNPKGKETEFEYRLRRTDGTWRIVDIRISGVSQLAHTRAQFVSVLDREGFDELIATLKRKIQDFAGAERR
ncbi:MAG: ABC transporter substrate-binding protein [Chloroflexota bacterium]